ncbi:MAG: ABC transporter ATP-binding protein [Clostridiales bacterium]|nr:ABC transporter ATP-binding protein [Clostridiales bacterium]
MKEKKKLPGCKAKLFGYFRRYWFRYTVGVFFVILATVMNSTIPDLLGKAIDVMEKEGGVLSDLFRYVGLMAGCAVLAFTSRFIWRQLIMGFTRAVELNIRNDLFTHLQSLSPEYYVKNNTGDLITKCIQDTTTIRQMLGMGLVGFIDVLTTNLVTIIYMIKTADVRLTLLAIIPLPFLLLALIKLRSEMRRRFSLVQIRVSEIAGKVQENMTGIRVIKAFAQEKKENEQFEAMSREKWKAEMALARVFGLINPLTTLVFGIVFSLFLYFGAKMVIAGTLSLGAFVAFNTYIGTLMNPVKRLSRIIQVWQRGIVSIQRMDTILTAEPAITDDRADMSLTEIEDMDLEVRDLTFRYPETDVDVLKNVSFRLPSGGVLAVMGPTGCGKSTLLALLMRMWNPPRGSILVSGKPIEHIPLKTLRSSVGYVPQDTFLFSDSIMDNIRFYDDSVSEEEAMAAAKAAVIHDNIMEFEKGYGTVVGERGMTLSGGQKQRVSIARALARHPSLLLLDDCLSAVDAETEHEIIGNLREYLRGSTTIIVTHRINAASLADRIMLLNEDGSVAALGTHEELMRTSPEYNRLLEITEGGVGQ